MGFATQGTPRQGKYAVRGIVAVYKGAAADELLKSLLKKLGAAEATDEHLPANLAARTEIAVQAPALFAPALDRTVDQVKALLLHAADNRAARPTGTTKVQALKLLVRAAAKNGGVEHVRLVLKLLGGLVKAKGEPTAAQSTSAADRELLRKYALSGLLFLARQFDALFTAADFLHLVWAAPVRPCAHSSCARAVCCCCCLLAAAAPSTYMTDINAGC